ncbi:uncharacterized protein LOC109854858 isoform X1 [Pseudomyrmex gracilis]|uniref:uncharacterized protein LOC109854858 isoform X1 n=1 Tax=Pseudomyrmex gracilis TaxID=219809 RepID=UPI000995C319|nr:uncharacterized protein LOC109854858 isoform X1 [Pseudomyrmex gracilis]
MSETNKSVSTSDGDASKKTDCLETAAISQLAVETKCADDAASEKDASTEEIAATPMSAAENSATNSRPAEEVENTVAPEEAPQITSEDKCRQNAGDNETYISGLQAEVRVRKRFENLDCPVRNESSPRNEERTKECDTYRKKLDEAETKLAALQTSCDAMTSREGVNENALQQSVEQLRGQLAQTALMYEERNRMVANQENQINALNNQVTSLKEVVSITRDLLEIRNVEVKQLQTEVDSMAKKITEERDRHNTMISKMDAAMRLNADLKKEYETQLALFQSLREKYGEKINLLSREKQALEETAIPAPK